MCISRHDNTEWEYGIKTHAPWEDGLHRGPMTEAEARQWIAEWLEDGGGQQAFWIVRRPIGEWEVVE